MNESNGKRRVLVVDDNEDAAITLSILLESAGYDVETCFDPAVAMVVAERSVFDAYVLDINMPGMDGYELARRLREKCGERVPIFATVTAYEDYSHLEHAADAGFDLHFTKPANFSDLVEQLNDQFEKADAENHDSRQRHLELEPIGV